MSLSLYETLNLLSTSVEDSTDLEDYLKLNENNFDFTINDGDLKLFFNRLRLFENLNQIDNINSIDFSELKAQLCSTIVFIGNFKNLPVNLFKHLNNCQKGTDYENVSVSALHSILLVINCICYISYLIETCKYNRSSSSSASICEYIGKKFNGDDVNHGLMIDISYYLAYNLSYFNLIHFNQKIDEYIDIDTVNLFSCECVKENWNFLYKILKAYDDHNNCNVTISVLNSVSYIIKDKPMIKYDYDPIKIYLEDYTDLIPSNIEIFVILLQKAISDSIEINSSGIFKVLFFNRNGSTLDLLVYDNFKLLKSLIKDLSQKQHNELTLNLLQTLIKRVAITNTLKVCQTNKKSFIDLLSNLWELHYSKQLNDISAMDADLVSYKYIGDKLAIINSDAASLSKSNVYLNYIRLIRQNLTDDYTWRLFKGRLYTRLHDKRINELNFNAILNLSLLFLCLTQSITQPIEPAQNLLRILSIFEEKSSKSSDDNDSVSGNGNDDDLLINLRKTINFKIFKLNISTKFLIIEQYYRNTIKNSDNESEMQTIIDNEILLGFSAKIKKLIQSHKKILDINRNQLNFKNSQIVTENLNELVITVYMKNLIDFLDNQQQNTFSSPHFPFKLIECVDVDYLLKNSTRSQCEFLFDCLTKFIDKINKLEPSIDTKNKTFTDYVLNLIKILNKSLTQSQSQQHGNDAITNLYYEICCFLIKISPTPTTPINDTIDQFVFNFNDHHTVTSSIRIKFLMKLLNNYQLVQYCEKRFNNGAFQMKLFGFIVNFYILYDADVHYLNAVVRYLNEKNFQIFQQLNLQFDCDADVNIEQLFNDFIVKYSFRFKLIEDFNAKKIEIENFNLYFHDFFKLINSLSTLTSHSTIYKCYLLASQIIFNCSTFLYSRGRSDTIFAQIIDKMVLPRFLNAPTSTANTNNAPNAATSLTSISASNNHNSIWIALKDTLHLFLHGISDLNYEYDSYLQRVIKSIISNYTMRPQLVSNHASRVPKPIHLLVFLFKKIKKAQLDEHFLVITIDKTFYANANVQLVQYRSYLMKTLKDTFLQETKFNIDTEKILGIVEFIIKKTELSQIRANDAEIFLPTILLLLNNENILLKIKANLLFEQFMELTATHSELLETIIVNFIDRKQLNTNKDIVNLVQILNVMQNKNRNLFSQQIIEILTNKFLQFKLKFYFNFDTKNILQAFFKNLNIESDLFDI